MPEHLFYLALVSALTALLWMPTGVDLMLQQGMGTALGNRHDLRPFSPWAERAKRAHANAVENLVVFAAVVLAADAAGVADATTGVAAAIYFWARLAHFIVYAAGIIGLRTAVWAVAWLCELVVAWQVLSA